MDMKKETRANLNHKDTQYAAEKSKAAMKEAISGNPEEARAHMKEGVEQFQHKGKDFAEQQKHFFADELNHFGEALHRASADLEKHKDTNASWVEDVAGRLDQFANYIDHNPTDKIMNDSADFARHHPYLTAGALVAAGVAVSRFLRSGTDRDRDNRTV